MAKKFVPFGKGKGASDKEARDAGKNSKGVSDKKVKSAGKKSSMGGSR